MPTDSILSCGARLGPPTPFSAAAAGAMRHFPVASFAVSYCQRYTRAVELGHETPDRNAIVLLSGGLDSATTLAIATGTGLSMLCDVVSIRAASRSRNRMRAQAGDCRWRRSGTWSWNWICGQIGGSALTGDMPVPKHDHVDDMEAGIPATYVPARNTIFLSLALGLGGSDPGPDTSSSESMPWITAAIRIAVRNSSRPLKQLANVATRAGSEGQRIHVHAPLLHWTKAQIIARGVELGVDYACTTSCYDPFPDGTACGHCDACLLRRRGFEENHWSIQSAMAGDKHRYSARGPTLHATG